MSREKWLKEHPPGKLFRIIVRKVETAMHSRLNYIQIKSTVGPRATHHPLNSYIYLFIYLGFYVTFNTVQVISQRVVGRAEKTSTYSSSGFCTVNCQPSASNYQLSHLRPCLEPNPGLRGWRRECYHSATVAPNSYI